MFRHVSTKKPEVVWTAPLALSKCYSQKKTLWVKTRNFDLSWRLNPKLLTVARINSYWIKHLPIYFWFSPSNNCAKLWGQFPEISENSKQWHLIRYFSWPKYWPELKWLEYFWLYSYWEQSNGFSFFYSSWFWFERRETFCPPTPQAWPGRVRVAWRTTRTRVR